MRGASFSFLAFVLVLALGCPRAGGSGAGHALGSSDADSAVPALPALAHVRVGQRYVYRVEEAGTSLELVWEVRGVGPGRVDYTAQLLRDGRALGAPQLIAWTAGAGPPAVGERGGAVLPPVELELAGRRWRARVFAEGERRVWLALEGDRPTFPPLLREERAGVEVTALDRIEEPGALPSGGAAR
ncbi:MAG: hypothetical protein D6731_06645 [Planctomycetota bacterium]|nr:MAG: hypothetical protein D6731_06645 [Planctomycetota bacterium]